MVTQEQIIKGIANYYEVEICQKASGLMQFGAYFLLPSIPARAQSILSDPKVSPILSDLRNEDGLYDLEEVKKRASEAMRHVGRLEIYGVALNDDDVNMIYNYIKRS